MALTGDWVTLMDEAYTKGDVAAGHAIMALHVDPDYEGPGFANVDVLLDECARRGMYEAARELVNVHLAKFETPLHDSVIGYRMASPEKRVRVVECARVLIDELGADVNRKMYDCPPLVEAAGDWAAPLVELFLSRGADRDATDRRGWTAARCARGGRFVRDYLIRTQCCHIPTEADVTRTIELLTE